jgi:hypothetical protein
VTPHLTPEQLVDLAEGTQRESSLPHLPACDVCRRQLGELRAVMAQAVDAGNSDVPEPWPLFWDHLSSRVRLAVADEQARPRSWRERVLQPLVLVPAFGAALAVAILAVVAPRQTVAPTIPSSPLPLVEVSVPSTSTSLPPLGPLGAADDPQLTIVAAVATTIDWDEMRDEVAMAAGGTSDAVVGALTVDERRELQRLLAEEMAQPRALENRS